MKLNLPAYRVRTTVNSDGDKMIFDRLRLKFVALTPEEWVRQHFVEFMIMHKGFPASLMANEVGINLNGTKRRCDTVVFDRYGSPVVIVEYKSPSVEVTQKTFDQIVRYNMVLHASYLIVSNGMSHYCCAIDYVGHSYSFMPDIPDYDSL
ncbi:MAG: type I restriction enzyme HsdR N-terminal domain-containing protein [Muribaculum sp.]|nr:type I restriction enzyme HsdR N-terminal domain-containing protein [Muribaculum sp.]